jgi:hypothetical protein
VEVRVSSVFAPGQAYVTGLALPVPPLSNTLLWCHSIKVLARQWRVHQDYWEAIHAGAAASACKAAALMTSHLKPNASWLGTGLLAALQHISAPSMLHYSHPVLAHYGQGRCHSSRAGDQVVVHEVYVVQALNPYPGVETGQAPSSAAPMLYSKGLPVTLEAQYDHAHYRCIQA